MEQLLAYSLNRTIGPIKTHTKYFVKWNLDHFPTQEEYDRLEAADKQRQKNERQLAARLAKGKGKGK